MRLLPPFIALLVLASCAGEESLPPSPDHLQKADTGAKQQQDTREASDGLEVWKQMQERDALLRERHKRILVDMTPEEVEEVMGVEPRIVRESVWGFDLSPASNTSTEVDWVLLVAFSDGRVSRTQVTYTCIYCSEPR
jgi:hypothetical protein